MLLSCGVAAFRFSGERKSADARKTRTKIRSCAKNFHVFKKLLSAKSAFFSL
jgi:hypothetical protein